MLTRTFQVARGIGPKTEARLWAAGCVEWGDCVPSRKPAGIPQAVWDRLCTEIRDIWSALDRADGMAIARCLPTRFWWRAIPEFLGRVAFLDIETTGLVPAYHHVTVISVYDGKDVRAFVRGENLEDFAAYMQRFPAVVTFNGRWFDGPFIAQDLGVQLPELHFDLRPLLRKVGLRGGLKAIEVQLGINRGALAQVTGDAAVSLWQAWRRTGERRYRDTLVAYNIEDTVNLDRLLRYAYNRLVQQEAVPFPPLPQPASPAPRPLMPDAKTLAELGAIPSMDPWVRRTLVGMAGRYRGECGFLGDSQPEFKNALDLFGEKKDSKFKERSTL
jgi:uncharacterized protein YprB with RNaseH-like and TPR domain